MKRNPTIQRHPVRSWAGKLFGSLLAPVLLAAPLYASEFPLVKSGVPQAVIVLKDNAGPIAKRAAEILQNRVDGKTGVELRIVSGEAVQRLPPSMGRLVIGDPSDRQLAAWLKDAGVRPPQVAELGEEGFSLRTAGLHLFVLAKEGRGLIYGVGKVLHTASYDGNTMLSDAPEGVEKPAQHLRVLYLATHFENFFELQPLSAIEPILEEAALWGINGVTVWFDQSQYNDPFDPKAKNADARAVWTRQKEILLFAQNLGLKPGFTTSANAIYLDQANPSILAPAPLDKGDAGRPLADPTVPGGRRVILKNNENLFRDAAASGIRFDNVSIGLYDTGGCASEACKPWILTALKLSKDQAAVIHRFHPSARIYMQDWLFSPDEVKMMVTFFNRQKPEWLAGIWEEQRHPFSDYAQLDQKYDKFRFQDITMIGGWGAVGANPFPRYFKLTFGDMPRNGFYGYMAYSEGIFDDYDKVLTAQLAWNPSETTGEIAREYCDYFFSSRIAEPFSRMVNLMEDGWNDPPTTSQMTVRQALRILNVGLPEATKLQLLTASAAAQLPAGVRQSWRWQLFEKRAKIEWLAANLQDPETFLKGYNLQLARRYGVERLQLQSRIQEKRDQLKEFNQEIVDLRSKIYHEPPTRKPSLDPISGAIVTTTTSVLVAAWEWIVEKHAF